MSLIVSPRTKPNRVRSVLTASPKRDILNIEFIVNSLLSKLSFKKVGGKKDQKSSIDDIWDFKKVQKNTQN